jgi:N-acetylglucosaminyldiphosphoundecaprenol N-acetyl-beta-D-mannosaminyltransferase
VSAPSDTVACGSRLVLGVPIAAATMEEVVERCHRAIRERGRIAIGVVNAAKVVKMSADPELRAAVLAADLIVADGMSVVWASRLLGTPLPERVAGIDLFERLLELADRHRFSVYLLGARQQTVEEVARRVAERHPGARIVGVGNGYFSEAEEPAVVEAINAARPDLLFIGISTPKKELFMARWRARVDVPVCHGVGGSFDVIAGEVRRAPARWQAWGLEWLYRLLQEPRRMWKRYLVTNTVFAGMLAAASLRRALGRESLPPRAGERPDPEL